MTVADQNKKTLRHFQCRDYLWEVFEQMSAELECSTDYLINEAMRQYARSRNYSTSQPPQAPSEAVTNPPPAHAPAAVPATAPGGRAIPSLRQSAVGRATVPVPRQPPRPSAPMPPQRQMSAPPPPPPRAPSFAQAPAAAPPMGGARPHAQLYVVFNGQKIPVSKDEFVIGRGARSADLTIRDGNISRRHAAIVFQNGAHYLKDLGSTNGLEYRGQRFESKRIEEGDVVRVCDYELGFTYQ
jgi:hypothetical protein